MIDDPDERPEAKKEEGINEFTPIEKQPRRDRLAEIDVFAPSRHDFNL